MSEKKFYKCAHCGNLFETLIDKGVTPWCCGEAMALLTANTTDAATEKHVPVLERNGRQLTVKIGAVTHPMQDDHYIQWILVTQNEQTLRAELKPSDAPEATFTLPDENAPVVAYEYCNLHGLWKAE